MSKGDNLFGIPTTYKGVAMRSKLESKFAYFLDTLNIEWKYEPRKFMLSNGIYYIPDFYLPELNMWVEVKGDIKEHNKEISGIFCKDNNTEMILVSSEEIFWFSVKEHYESNELCEDSEVMLNLCEYCKKYYFCSNLHDYSCRHCWKHNGDHNSRGLVEINFSNIDEIKFGTNKLK